MSSSVVAMMMAMDKNKLIGQAGGMPWHIPGEMAYFKRVTMGKPVVMGRKTFESIGKPLPGRPNIVVTRDSAWSAQGVTIVHSLNDALNVGREALTSATTDKGADSLSPAASEIMLIGGAGLCRDAMPITQRLYLTVIDFGYVGDTWLDSFHWEDWRVVSEDPQDPAKTGGVSVSYWVLEKG